MALQQTLTDGKKYSLEFTEAEFCFGCVAWPFANGMHNEELCHKLTRGFPAKPNGDKWECPKGKVWKEIK